MKKLLCCIGDRKNFTIISSAEGKVRCNHCHRIVKTEYITIARKSIERMRLHSPLTEAKQ